MAAWANPLVGRLASDPPAPGEYCGLILVCSWPMPREVLDAYSSLRAELQKALPPEAYVYPPETLHCTVCTLRAFTAGPMGAADQESAHARWAPVLAEARAAADWPAGAFRLRMNAPTFEGSTGIFRYEDLDGAIGRMRACLREAISKAGGRAAEGSQDRSAALPLPGSPAGDPAPHLPDITHSTVMRWAAEPSGDRGAVAAAFEKLAATWQPMELQVEGAVGVLEDVPYMHIPHDAAHVWWPSKAGEAAL